MDAQVKELFLKGGKHSLLPQIFADTFDFTVFTSNEQIQAFRSAAYPVPHSFVKFLIQQVGLEKAKKIYGQENTDKAIRKITGKSKDG